MIIPQDIIIKYLEDKILTVYEDGRVFSKRWPKPLGCLSSKGYKVCTLHFGDIRKQCKIHQIVWIAFNGKIPNGFVVDHINRNKIDNRIENLRLAEPQLNSENRRRYNGTNNPSVKITYMIASQIKDDYQKQSSYSKTAKNFNVSKSLIAQIIRGELWN